MGKTLWRHGTQQEGCTNHSFIHVHMSVGGRNMQRGLQVSQWSHFKVKY
jgi:hypothetical protein